MAASPLTFSEIAHHPHLFCNPISAARADQVIEHLDLAAGARVLDLGCGKGELMLRVAARYRARVLGIDRSAVFLAEARRRARERGIEDLFEARHREVAKEDVAPRSADLVLCVGSTQVLGGYRKALPVLRDTARRGGLVVVGEGYWRQPPARGYLKVLGAKADDFTDHRGNVGAAAEAGLVHLYSAVSSAEDWDVYEGLYLCAVERWADAHPDDPAAPAHRARIRRWHDAYLRWGRETLGFALYLFGVPAS